MKKALLMLLAIQTLPCFSICDASAEEIENLPTFIGGGQKCSAFLHSEMQANSEDKLMIEAYFAGYLSARISMLNFQQWEKIKLGGHVGQHLIDQKKDINIFIINWLRNYCIQNPDTEIALASNDLYFYMERNGY